MTSLGRLLSISFVGSVIGSLIWLFGGTFWGGSLVGAVFGLLVTAAFPKIIEFVRNEPVIAAPNHFPIKHIAVVVAVTSVFTLGIVHYFQAYTLQVAKATNVSLIGDGERYEMTSVVWDGQRYVAVGTHSPNGTGDTYLDGAVWDSTDGYTWKRLPNDPKQLGDVPLPNGGWSNVTMNAIRKTDNGCLILGSDNAPDGSAHGRIWRLRDGMDTVESADDVVLPSATYYSGYERHDSTELISGADTNNVLIWNRTNNGNWSAVSIGAAGQVDVYSIRYIQDEWVLAGWDKTKDPDYAKTDHKAETTENVADGAVWTSKDGLTWHETKGFAGQQGHQQVNDVAWAQGTWVAVGQDDFGDSTNMDAAIWTSDDGEDWRRLEDRALSGAAGWQAMLGVVVVDDKMTVVGGEVPASDGTANPAPARQGEAKLQNAVWQIDFERRTGSRTPWSVARRVFRSVF